MEADGALGDGEAEPGPARLAVARVVNAVEGAEDVREPSARRRLKTSKPFMPGIITSSTTSECSPESARQTFVAAVRHLDLEALLCQKLRPHRTGDCNPPGRRPVVKKCRAARPVRLQNFTHFRPTLYGRAGRACV